MSSDHILNPALGLKDRTAFLTGGLGGIGRASVAALLAHGVKVAFTYAQGQESMEAALALVATSPEHLSCHALDLRYYDSIRTCVLEAQTRFGHLDILVNNAAVGSATVSAYAKDLPEQDSVMFLVNADGALKVCQVFMEINEARHDPKGNLKIINVSSVGGAFQVFPAFRLSDGMSKAAVSFMTRNLAAKEVHSHFDVFAVCPGATNTRMLQTSTIDPMSAQEKAQFFGAIPKNRLIEPQEIANIVVFLASQYSTPLHGAVLDCSMGLGVRPGLMTEMAH